ncbi:MAG TPA: hypothetical protein PKD91_00025 [Bacteroidia bacterium]|nr:hypothetical protein [Bacteroidia bacterium]
MKNWISIVLLFVLEACTSGFSTQSDFYKWWNNPDNGLVKSKTIGDFRFVLKYLPPEYQALNEIGETKFSTITFDSLRKAYSNNRSFLLTIEPAVEKDVDVLFKGIISYEEYKERILQLNFLPADFIALYADGVKYKPVLSTMENLYNLSPKKSLYLVFSPEKSNDVLTHAEELVFEFSDQIFMTGINKFVFNKSDLTNIPEFTYLKK